VSWRTEVNLTICSRWWLSFCDQWL
jgi:hypothetical protein